MEKFAKVIHRYFFVSLIVSVFLCSFSCQNQVEEGKTTITIAIVENQKIYLEKVIDNFNKSQDSFEVRLETYSDEETKNYYFYHGDINADIITFDNIYYANKYEDLLYPLEMLDVIFDYQTTIINMLKTSNGRLNGIPAPGNFYTNCFNKGLFEKRNFELPETMTDLLYIARKMELYYNDENSYSCSSFGGRQMLVQTLMEVAFPYFLSSTQGHNFLKKFYTGEVSLSDSKYIEYWKEIFNIYYSLFDLNYYNINDVNSLDNGSVQNFIDENTICLQNNSDVSLEDEFENHNIDYILYPYVGKNINQQFVGSKPIFYFSINKSITKRQKALDGAIGFIEFYSTEDSQKNSLKEKQGYYISYIKDVFLDFNKNYEALEKIIKSGKVFLIDTFQVVFSLDVDALYDYLLDNISQVQLLNRIDEAVKNNATKIDEVISVNENFDYDEIRCKSKETKINNYMIDSIRKSGKVSMAVSNNGLVKANIFKNGITKKELREVILNNERLQFVRIKGEGIKILLEEYFKNEEIILPLISGMKIDKKNNSLVLKDFNDNLIENDAVIFALIPEDKVNNVKNYILNFGSVVNSVDLIVDYIDYTHNVIVPKLDGRYGGYV